MSTGTAPVAVSVGSDILLLADAVICAADEATTAASALLFSIDSPNLEPHTSHQQGLAHTAQHVAAIELVRTLCGFDTRLVSFFARYSKMQQFASAVKQLLVLWEGVSLGLHGHCLKLFGLIVDHAKTVSFASVFDAGVIGLLWHFRFVRARPP